MKVYLSAPFSRQNEMQSYRNDLHEIGWDVVSSWVEEEQESAENYSNDLDEIIECDCLILFNDIPAYSSLEELFRGGRMVEYGFALAKGKVLVVIGKDGPHTSGFLKMPKVTRFDTWNQFMNYVRL